MNLLQVFFIISGFVIFILAYDISQRQKFNALHFLVFLAVGVGLFIFTLFPETLNLLGRVFGLQRGADVLVYASIVFLLYFSLLLLTKNERNREDITRLVREISLLETRLSMQSKSEAEDIKITQKIGEENVMNIGRLGESSAQTLEVTQIIGKKKTSKK